MASVVRSMTIRSISSQSRADDASWATSCRKESSRSFRSASVGVTGQGYGRSANRLGHVQSVIRTEKLTKRFGDLVCRLLLEKKIREGEVFGFLGPNGAGKTTTLRLLCALI